MTFYLGFDGEFEGFLKVLDQVDHFWSPVSIKFKQDRLQTLKAKNLILKFFKLIQRVPFEFGSNICFKGLEITKICQKKNLNFFQGIRIFAFLSSL